MKGMLKDLEIAVTGDFGVGRAPADFKRWVTANGGHFTSKISPVTTHLICSKAHWKKRAGLVPAVLEQNESFTVPSKNGSKARPRIKGAQKSRIKIVSYDWFEDSLRDNKKKAEKTYEMSTISAVKAEEKKDFKSTANAYIEEKGIVRDYNKGCEQAELDLHSDSYHIYRDPTSFTYNVILSRPNIVHNSIPRIRLTLYESSSAPFTYAAVAVHYPGRYAPDESIDYVPASQSRILACLGSPFFTAFIAFKTHFRAMTGVEWDFRTWGYDGTTKIGHWGGLGQPHGFEEARMLRAEHERVKMLSTGWCAAVGDDLAKTTLRGQFAGEKPLVSKPLTAAERAKERSVPPAKRKYDGGENVERIKRLKELTGEGRYFEYLVPRKGEGRGSMGLQKLGRETLGLELPPDPNGSVVVGGGQIA